MGASVVEHTWGTFDFIMFKVILGSFGALAIFQKVRFTKLCAFSVVILFEPNFSQFPKQVYTQIISWKFEISNLHFKKV